jgi:hypothetical protein
VSFARFFSLPLDPGLLAKIRREALSPAGEKFASGDKALSPKNREGAAALAAAAAAGKGVVLSREGLEAYAGFLSGQDAAGPEHPAEYAGPGDQPLGGEGGNSGGGGSPNKGGGGERRERPGEERPAVPVLKAGDVVNAERLREEILKTGDRHPLLNLLNRLPGKDGQRWMVFPFSVAGKTGEFRAVLRILLHESPSGRCPDRLALDISGGDLNNPAFRWLFIYNRQPGESPWMTVHIWPPEREKTLSAFQKELSDLLALPPEHIRLCNDGEFPQFAADCQDGVLRSINKEV